MNIINIKHRLRLYYEAEAAILSGQSYSMEGMSLTRANLATVQKMIAKLENALLKLENNHTKSRVRYVIPSDNLYRRK